MKITKYEHSCLDIEIDGKRLLIDPGILAKSIPNYENISAVIVTHVHSDHLDAEKLQEIHSINPEAPIFTVQAVADELASNLPLETVSADQKKEIGPFKLIFAGGQHATIHSSYPPTDNIGVTVNDKLYYSGDSLSLPSAPVDTLAVPVAAPWLKSSEAMDFIIALKPQRVFPVHDALLSEFGMIVNGTRLKDASESVGAEYVYLKPGQSLTI